MGGRSLLTHHLVGKAAELPFNAGLDARTATVAVRKARCIAAGEANPSEIDIVLDLGKNMHESAFCPMGMACANGVSSFISNFRDEFEAHIALKHCPQRVH